jgi:hypothetical protein
MKVGDLVRDIHANATAIIVKKDVEWYDRVRKHRYSWDYEIMVDGQCYFVDADDLEYVQKKVK